MSSSCKMHERLWIDTGPLISPHRQLPRSGVEPTPVAATTAAQIRGQREGERSVRATRVTSAGIVAPRWACRLWKTQTLQYPLKISCTVCLFFRLLPNIKVCLQYRRSPESRLEDKRSPLWCALFYFSACLTIKAIITHSTSLFFSPK